MGGGGQNEGVSISDDQSGEPREPGEHSSDDDWDSDDDVVKVHYDLAAWRLDQRAEATEAFAEQTIPHQWDGDELIVPEASEGDADAIFERLEDEIGPFAVLLGDDEESTEYGLDEWSERDREALRRALTEAEIPHRWHGTTVIVARDAEGEVDSLLDAIEAGDLVDLGDGDGPPEGTLGRLFSAADRLAKDPADDSGTAELVELSDALDERQAPYGVNLRVWESTVACVNDLVDLVGDLDAEPSDVIGAAQQLRTLVRPFV